MNSSLLIKLTSTALSAYLVVATGCLMAQTEGTLPPKEKKTELSQLSKTDFSEESTDNSRYASQAQRVSMEEKRMQYVEESTGMSIEEISESSSSEETISGAHSWSMHSNCRHNIISVYDDFSAIRLEDGSLWQVPFYERWTISRWFMEHRLYVTHNSLYSSYHFKIVNLDTNETVEANCIEKGQFQNPFSRIVEYVTYDGVRLNDGTFWKVDAYDYNYCGNWLPGDVVIVGVNTGFFSSYFSPYMIYNYNTNTHIYVKLY